MPRPSSARGPSLLIPASLLAAGLLLRGGIFGLPHREGDERIYQALVEQLRDGRGYTLRGHPILDEPWMIRDQYDTRLFYHPPAGIAWMVLLGLDVAQLAAFAAFFAGTWALARELLPRYTTTTAWVVGALAAATPIAAHVSVHRWLDGPQVAAVACAAWLAVRALRRGGRGRAALAGAAMGLALLVKLNAAVALGPIALLAWVASPDRPPAERVRSLAWIVGVAALMAVPWALVAPDSPGKPSPALVAENPFVRHVTVERSPFVYLRLLPTSVWTLVPALATAALLRSRRRGGAIAAALVVWIATVTAFAIGVGALGYSKLLRYAVLTAPATVVLAGWAAMRLEEEAAGGRRGLALVLSAGLLAGCALEIAHGIQAVRVYPDRAWIRPLIPGWSP